MDKKVMKSTAMRILLYKFLALVLVIAMVIGSVPASAASKTKTVSSKKKLLKEIQKETSGTITFSTSKDIKVKIPNKKGSGNKNLIIDAPNATIMNYALFESVTIKAVKQYTEKASGNTIQLKGDKCNFFVGSKKAVKKLTVFVDSANITAQKKGIIEELICANKNGVVNIDAESGADIKVMLQKKSDLFVDGSLKAKVYITSEAKGVSISSSIPIDFYARKSATLTLETGSEGTIVDSDKAVNVKINNNSNEAPTIKSEGKIVSTSTPKITATVTPKPSVTPVVTSSPYVKASPTSASQQPVVDYSTGDSGSYSGGNSNSGGSNSGGGASNNTPYVLVPTTSAVTSTPEPTPTNYEQIIPTEEVETLDFERFAREGAELIKENGYSSGIEIAENGEFASKRLIVRGKSNSQLDFTHFNPKAVIKSEDMIYLIQFASVSEVKNAFYEICNWTDVEWVEPDTYCDVDIDDNISTSSKSWGVSKIGADKYADSISSIRDEIVVAVVDTGVSNHEFLSGRIQSGGYDFVDNDSDPSDKHYHGTHVAGTIVDCTSGLNVKVLPVRVLNENGSGSYFNVGNGIKYAADHGAKIINLSLGGSHSNYLDENIEYAINKGVVVVVAAGNENSDTSYCCPAHIDNVIVVAAVDEYDRRASFSNYGNSVDVCAPGVGVISCVPGGSYRSLNGTSMAAPHVAAVAAMFRLKYPLMTPAQIETLVKETVRDLGSEGWDKYYGYGIPDISNDVDVEPTGVTLDQTAASVRVREVITLTATISPSNATDKTVTWNSDDTSVATVDKGKVTGVSEGTATITAKTSNGKTATCTVDVVPTIVEPAGVTLDQDTASIKVGDTITLTATVTPSNATDKTVTWSSDDTSVATVDKGKVTGLSVGTANITVKTTNGKTATCRVDVVSTIVEPTGVTLDQDTASIKVGETVTLTATVTPSNATDKTVTWSSDNISVATVDKGKVTGLSQGTALITVETANGLTATCTIVVPKTEEDWSGYYKVYDASDFADIRNDVCGNYVLMNDIDLSVYSNWEPICGFTGILDGNNHVIKGVRIYEDDIILTSQQYSSARYGLFGSANGATFKNMTVDISIALAFQHTVANATGGICGYAFKDTLFENCHTVCNFDVKSQSMSRVGGICGYVDWNAKFIGCSTSGIIDVSTQSSGIHVGGICGNLDSNGDNNIFQDCINNCNLNP